MNIICKSGYLVRHITYPIFFTHAWNQETLVKIIVIILKTFMLQKSLKWI